MHYKGKITTTGSSEAIRLDKDLFRQNPEFKQQSEVRADIIGPGKMLISVVDAVDRPDEEDPIIGAFLSFLEKDIADNPGALSKLSSKSVARAKELTKGVAFNDQDFE